MELVFPAQTGQVETEAQNNFVFHILKPLLSKFKGKELEEKLKHILTETFHNLAADRIRTVAMELGLSLAFSLVMWYWWTVVIVVLLISAFLYLSGVMGPKSIAVLILTSILLTLLTTVAMATVFISKLERSVRIMGSEVGNLSLSIVAQLSRQISKMWKSVIR